jgi:transposase
VAASQRRAGFAEMHGLAAQGLSQRAIARQTGHNRKTVKHWLQQEPELMLDGAPSDAQAAPPPPATADQRMLKQTARRDKLAQVQALGDQGQSHSAIARQVGLHRVTVKKWLQEASPAATDRSALSPAERVEPEPPPAPWTKWEEVKQIRETLKQHRFLLLRRPEHLSAVEQALVTTLLEQPGCAELRVARDFLIDWYRLWTDENGQRRAVAEAQAGFETWRADVTYAALPALKQSQERLTPARFEGLSHFLQHPDWEATNNGAERAGRAFRHRQAPHFNLRKDASIERSIVVTACLRKQALTEPDPQRLHTCQRGRRSRQAQDTGLLLAINQPQELAVA